MPSPAERPQCDIVMKGGITSGAVYPLVIDQIAQEYDFRSVGGTSVGAIAAAAAAAAEHRRRTGGGGAGFAVLAQLPQRLCGEEGGEARLAGFFQPDPGMRLTYRVLGGLLTGKKLRAAAWFLLCGWEILVAAVALIALAAVLGALGYLAWGWAVLTIVGTSFIAIPAIATRFVQGVLRGLPKNDFGFCRLGPLDEDDDDQRPLTVWVHRLLREIAFGETEDGRPLLLRELWGSRALHEARWDSDHRDVNLELMTTDLTRGRAIRLPVPLKPDSDEPAEHADLVFGRHELSDYFPKAVMEHLCREDAQLEDADQALLRETSETRDTFYRLPVGAELPVVVAVRMSLSFPVLISALPLWRLPEREGDTTTERVAQRIYLTDGGATSNFPVHFFDAALPRRPTFVVNLVGTVETKTYEDPGDYVVAPDAAEWDVSREIRSAADFVVALKDATQNWRDNAQAALPGYKERMFGLALAPGEGGLNLGMSAEQLTELGDRGEAAGKRILQTFPTAGDEPDSDSAWNTHRFQRFRIAMALLDDFLRAYRRGYEDAMPAHLTDSYRALIAAGVRPGRYGFPGRRAQLLALTYSGALVALGRRLDRRPGRTMADKEVKRPLPSLRIGPRA